jgi:four helix bundle protein
MPIEQFEQLDVWRRAHALVLVTYKRTKLLPDDERYGLSSQMRRAAVSIASNIAEGFKRRGLGDKLRHYNIAQSSLEELRYGFVLCQDLGYCTFESEHQELVANTGRLLSGLVRATRWRQFGVFVCAGVFVVAAGFFLHSTFDLLHSM